MRGSSAAGLRAAKLVHLQGVGDVPGKPAEDLQLGDVTLWNYGYAYEVVGKRRVSSSFFMFSLKNIETGKVYEQRMKEGRLVAIERHRHPGHARTR